MAHLANLGRRDVAMLDDGRLEGLAPKLQNLRFYFARYRVQRASLAAGPGVLPALSAFVTSCTAKPIRFGIQQRVEGRRLHRHVSALDVGLLKLSRRLLFNSNLVLVGQAANLALTSDDKS
jgi:hypothetical protein